MANVIVIGAGLGGLPTAYELRDMLPCQHKVTLVSDKSKFTFIPGLIRVSLDLNPLDHLQLDLEKMAQKHGIEWVHGEVTALDPDMQQITIGAERKIDYDYVAIATGPTLAFDHLSGLGPYGDKGYTNCVCTPSLAMKARSAWVEFLKNPGPLVVGATPGAACFGPAYEFVLMADWVLRRRGLRDKVEITYVTSEPYAGHFGVGGVKNAKKLTGSLLEKQGIKVIDNATITDIEASSINLSDGRKLPFEYSMIIPPFRGVKFVKEALGLSDAKGFIPVLPTCQHIQFPSIYALGVCVQLKQPEKTAVPIGLPKSGQMSEAMGVAVAHNIAVKLGAVKSSLKVPTLEAVCFAEFGDTGITYIAAPVIPDSTSGKRRYSLAIQGFWVNWMKLAFEEYFLLKMKMGLGVPWFEKLGLRLLFRLSLLKPLSVEETKLIDAIAGK